MKRPKKGQLRKSAPTEPAKKSPLIWWLGIIAIASLAFVAASSNVFKRRPAKTVSPQPKAENSVAATNSVTNPPAGSVEAVLANADEQTDAEKATDLVNRGTELLDLGKIGEAIARYKEAIKLNPEDEDMHYNLALALAKQGNRDGAKEQYLEALRIFPDYAEAHNNLGNLLVSEKNFTEAIAHFNAVLKISPENASAHNNLGNALARQGKLVDAIPSFTEAVRLKPDYLEAHYNLGSAYLSLGGVDQAISEFNEILQHRPDFAPAQKALQKARKLKAR